MPISVVIDGATTQHGIGAVGTAAVIDASSSSVLVEAEDLSSQFSGSNATGTVSRFPILNSDTVSVVVSSSTLTQGQHYSVVAAAGDIDFSGGTAPYGNPSATAEVLVTYETGASAAAWSTDILDAPVGSASSIVLTATPGIINLTPDLPGSYLVQITLDDALVTETVGSAIIAVPTYKGNTLIPVAGEENEYDSTKGWQKKVEEAYLKFTTAGSYRHLTVGGDTGADFKTFSAAKSAIESIVYLGNNVLGQSAPGSSASNYYVIEAVSDLQEDIIVPDGVVFNANHNRLLGATGTTAPTVSLEGNSTLLNAQLPENANKTGIAVFISTAGPTSGNTKLENVYISSNYGNCAISNTPATLSNVKVLEDSQLGVDFDISTSTNSIVFDDCVLADVTSHGGTVIFNSSTLSSLTVDTAVSATSSIFTSQSYVSGDISIGVGVSGNLYAVGLSRTGDIINSASGFSIISRVTLSRDIIEFPAGNPSGTNIPLTNVSYIHAAGSSSPDFKNLLVSVDGLVMTVTESNTNSEAFDCYPGTTGGITLSFPIVNDTVVQVERDV